MCDNHQAPEGPGHGECPFCKCRHPGAEEKYTAKQPDTSSASVNNVSDQADEQGPPKAPSSDSEPTQPNDCLTYEAISDMIDTEYQSWIASGIEMNANDGIKTRVSPVSRVDVEKKLFTLALEARKPQNETFLSAGFREFVEKHPEELKAFVDKHPELHSVLSQSQASIKLDDQAELSAGSVRETKPAEKPTKPVSIQNIRSSNKQ